MYGKVGQIRRSIPETIGKYLNDQDAGRTFRT